MYHDEGAGRKRFGSDDDEGDEAIMGQGAPYSAPAPFKRSRSAGESAARGAINDARRADQSYELLSHAGGLLVRPPHHLATPSLGADVAPPPESMVEPRPRISPASADRVCAQCAAKVEEIVEQCRDAERTPKERRMVVGSNKYNYVRLREHLARHAFDELGGFRVHRTCLAARFEVSTSYISSVHQFAREMHRAPTAKIKKRDLTEASKQRVLLPRGADLDSYLESLDDDAEVEVTRETTSCHGLAGKQSNRCVPQRLARSLFRDFVMDNRSPAGRGITTQYFLNPQWRVLRKQRRDQGLRDDEIFTAAFMSHAQQEIEASRRSPDPVIRADALKAVVPKDHQTIEKWLFEDFGAASDRGHTVIHPPKADACYFCERYNSDMVSLHASLKRRTDHAPSPTADQRWRAINDRAINELHAEIADVGAALNDHRADHHARAQPFLSHYPVQFAARPYPPHAYPHYWYPPPHGGPPTSGGY